MSVVRVRSLLLRNPELRTLLRSQEVGTIQLRNHAKLFSSLERKGQPILVTPATVCLATRGNTQHRVVLLPELPPDTALDNPLLRTATDKLPHLTAATEANCYYGLGKALMTYESTIYRMEENIKAGEKDWGKLLEGLEESRVQLESVWNSVNLINIVTDKLDMDRFVSLNKRAERAFLSRYDSRTIHEFINSEDVANVKGEEKTLLDRYRLEYRNQGYDLPENKYLELNANWMKRLSEAQRDYRFKINRATQRFRHVIRDPTVVREFPVDLLRAMASDSSQPGKGPWSVTLHPYIHRKFMEYCPDKRIRWNAHVANVNRGSREVDVYLNVSSQVKDIRQHKLDQAVTLGYATFADMSLTTKMAGKVENVNAMISSMHGRAKTAQEIELAALQEYAEKRGFEDSIREFDVEFFKRKQIKSLFGVDEEATRDFFPLPHVLKNIFKLMEDNFNMVFTLVNPKKEEKPWAEEVSIYQVADKNGNIKGHCYIDPYIRDDKGYQGGDSGWYIPLRTNSEVAKTRPVGCIVMSLGTPGYGKPSLLSFNEVQELFKLVGKAVVHMSGSKKWAETSGRTGLEFDALNIIPDLMTHWLTVPQVLQALTCHWSTGEQLSVAQVENQIEAKKHMSGYATSHELFKAAYDISFYSAEYEAEPFQALADRLCPQYLVLEKEREDCFPHHFEEMLSGNWSAGYYSHLWSRMLAADIFSAYWEAGWDNQAGIAKVSQKITDSFLSSGSSVPMAELFREFRGRDPSPEALLITLGLSGSRSPKQRMNLE